MTALRLEQVASDPNQGMTTISFVKERLKTQGGVEQVYRGTFIVKHLEVTK